MASLRIIFAGTPEFACPALSALVNRGCPPGLVLTQPDRPAGRGRSVRPPPVKQLALDHGLEVFQPVSLKEGRTVQVLRDFQPDLLITAAYGLILPSTVLSLPPGGCWNLHASLLPRWRGASPIQQAILAGDRQTGISLMAMDEGLDTGPVIFSRSLEIGPEENAGTLHDRLAELAGQVVDQALDALTDDRLPAPRAQDDSRATHAPLIRKSDARLEWNRPAEELARAVRAYNPWPVAHGEVGGEPVRVFRARPVEAAGQPGELITGHGVDAIRVACGRGALDLLELQRPGKRRMAATEWLNARPDWR